MTTAKLNRIVQSLAINRPFFYSEADFQHSLALELDRQGYIVYLEYPINGEHIDIIIEKDGWYYPIELKYKTKAFSCPGLFGTTCSLKNQHARDLGRYDYWKDVRRIEDLKIAHDKIREGYAIILTNDSEYWTELTNDSEYWTRPSKNTIDCDFKLHTGMNVQDVFWHNIPQKAKNDPDYVAGRTTYAGFSLSKRYNVPGWIDYSTVNRTQVFKFLTINV